MTCPKCGADAKPHCETSGGCAWGVCRRDLCQIVFDPKGRTMPIFPTTKDPSP